MILYEDYINFDQNCSLSEHKSILEAIKGKDPAEVIREIQAHVERGFLDLDIQN